MANENQIKHKIVISGEQEYKRAMREMGTSLKEAKSEVKATAAEMDAQGKSVEGLTAQMRALETQRQKEADMLREMQRHLEAVVAATGEESDEAVRLRTRINAMRTEIAQTTSQMAKLTGEMDEAKEAAEGLGGSGAANGIKGLGAAAESAEGDMDGILGKLSTLGQGFTIGIGANLGSGVADIIKNAVATAITEGWNDAVEHRIEYNQIGVKTGTAGTGLNDYMASQLDRLKVTNPNRNATEWIDALAAAYTNLPEGVFTNAARLNGLIARLDTVSVATGKSVPDLTEDIADLNRVFGTDFDDAAAILFWTGTGPAGQDGISALTEYATVWEKIGTDAMGAAAMLTLARISGVTNVQAVGKAAKNAGDFLGDFLGNKKALEDLGLLAEDLGPKFQNGGEEAKAAMTLLMNTFLGLDPEKQEEYGGKIFGEDNWKKYGTKIAEAIVGGYDEELTPGMMQALDDAQAAMTNDIPTRMSQLKELITGELGNAFQPAEDLLLSGLTDAEQAGEKARDEGGNVFLAILNGFAEGVDKAQKAGYATLGALAADAEYGFEPEDFDFSRYMDAEGMKEEAEEKGEENANAILEAYYAGAAKRNSIAPPDMPAGQATEVDEFLDRLTGSGGSEERAAAAEEAGREDAETMLGAYSAGLESGTDFESVRAQVEDLNAQIAAALGAGDNDLAADLQEKRNALIPTMMQLAADAKKTGEDAEGGFTEAFQGITVTVEDTATGAVEAWDSGISGLPAAGQRSVDGLMDVLNGARDPAYTAGWNAGDAFARGYRDAQGIRSPSRVMAEAARYTMEGLFEGLDGGTDALEIRAAGLSDTLARGAGRAGSTAAALSAVSGGGGVNMEELRELLSNIVLAIDGDVAGGLMEKGVSTASARRAAGTVSGRANGVRSW